MGLPYRSARESHRKGYKWWASVIHLFAVALLVAGSLRLPHPAQPDKSEDNFLGRTAVPRYQQQPELSCPLQAHWSCSKSIREVSTPTERISPDFQQVRLRLTTTQPVSALLLLTSQRIQAKQWPITSTKILFTLWKCTYSHWEHNHIPYQYSPWHLPAFIMWVAPGGVLPANKCHVATPSDILIYKCYIN